jgi:thioredoxin-related protein|tara:strand:+ start:177 stop:704 length:528 start_codon:yes stop_codon:yes gene_type:complete
MKRIIAAFVLLGLAFPATAFAQDSYDPAANASTLIKGALGRAKKDHKRVLVIFGTNEETKCTTLHNDTLRKGKIRRILSYEYEVTPVHFPSNKDLARELGANPETLKIPHLIILSGEGKPINNDTQPYQLSRECLETFLTKWKVEPIDAEEAYAAALAKAKKEKKRLLIHLGAPW